VEVKLAGNSLIIKGEKRQDHKEERDGYHLSERSYGSFQRSFALPEGVDRDKIEATSARVYCACHCPSSRAPPTTRRKSPSRRSNATDRFVVQPVLYFKNSLCARLARLSLLH